MSIVRSTTVALSTLLAFGGPLVMGVSPANAEHRPAVESALTMTAAGKSTQRIASGRTEPGVGWNLYVNNSPGLYIDVDTSAAHFTGDPVYTVSVGGLAHHFELTGTSTVYQPTATGFRVYIRWSNGQPLTVEDAQTYGWYVNWIGVDQP
ncbi:hypothetical protein [Nonomuraea indica]|uniref:Uncharacterized protein n=1 Tax=Nonomuraea indica TaxID=1581193 RepID=A0ABW8A293_9ACTN|nr:hypothetical protein [Nonomuraea indica]